MILTTHALIGAAIGKHVSNPWIIIILSLIIHFFLDTFRHGEYINKKSTVRDSWWKVALDLLAGLSIIAGYIYFVHPPVIVIKTILLATFVSMFPDLLTVLHWKFHVPFLEKAYGFHQKVHKFPDGSPERKWNLKNARNDIFFSILAIVIFLL